MKVRALLAAAAAACSLSASPAAAYENFKVAVYCRAQEVQKMADPAWLAASWEAVSREVHVDKVYIETHRDRILVDGATLAAAKRFFTDRGVKVAGGITFTVKEPNRYETFSYSNPAHRRQVREITEHTAKHFDEVILDDFFFTSTKSELDVRAKGNRSWTSYRLAVMDEAARNLVLGPARRVNPRVKVVIKYPNWYEHFPALGFDLGRGPRLFDGVYTGTETRDAIRSAQHLQPYQSYSIMRYFENVTPGRNGGGWVDTGGAIYYDRYAEQLWLTLFAKAAPEITLFDIRQMLLPLDPKKSAPRQASPTSFRFQDVLKPLSVSGGPPFVPGHYARVAGVSFESVDKVLGQLGRPVGIRSYKPHHSLGEDFLQNHLGMAGIPVEMVPAFPADDEVVLLTAQAAADPKIVALMEGQLKRGKNVVITSGLLRSLQGRGLSRFAELEHSGRVAAVASFVVGRGEIVKSEKPLLIPQVTYRTNDSWELVSALDGDNGWPVLHDADYLDGQLQVLTIPENFADFSNYPEPVLNAIRRVITAPLPVKLEAPGKVSLFVYDNGTFIVHNFRDDAVAARVVLAATAAKLEDLATREILEVTKRDEPGRFGAAGTTIGIASFTLPPHSYRTFKIGADPGSR